MENHEYNQADYALLRRLGADFNSKGLGKEYKKSRSVWNKVSRDGMPDSTLLVLAIRFQKKPENPSESASKETSNNNFDKL